MLGYIYYSAIQSTVAMFDKNRDFSAFTIQTAHHEPNFSFHLAKELWGYFPWLNCDFDVTKRDHDDQRPDIIFHKRGVNRFNFLVVEVKRRGHHAVNTRWICGSDETKIQEHWFADDLEYSYGLSVVLDETAFGFAFNLLINRNDNNCARFESFQHGARLESNAQVERLIERIKTRKNADLAADTTDLETAIDRIVFP